MNKFYGMKLLSGDTVYCEVRGIDDEKRYIVYEPMLFQAHHIEGGTTASIIPYAHYSVSREHRIPLSAILMIDLLSPTHILHYGNAVASYTFNRIREATGLKLNGNIIDDYPHLIEMMDTLKKANVEMQRRYPGITNEDFSEIEEKINKQKPVFN